MSEDRPRRRGGRVAEEPRQPMQSDSSGSGPNRSDRVGCELRQSGEFGRRQKRLEDAHLDRLRLEGARMQPVGAVKHYTGRIPACGIYCGGCPVYVRERRPCPGAEQAERCRRCKTFNLCCRGRGITHCWQCPVYPCSRFRGFARRWTKYGQEMGANQRMLREWGQKGVSDYFNKMAP